MLDEIVEGQIFAGKYRVERVLGVGGMGVVVAAHHLHLDQRVAVKLMLREALANPEAVARFAREARAAVKIKSEHVARVSDVGVLDSGAPYMVMEYLEGKDLSGWIQQHGQLPVQQAVEFVLQASEAIAEAHSLGIVHRDLKPANLFVVRRPDGALSVKVLDFGISKISGLVNSAPDFGMTKTSAIMGSPLYMSPEQMRSSRDADVRSDIWALGVILYELLAGATPFGAETMPELVLKISIDPPEPLRNRARHVPPELEAVILRCLEKDPRRRFASVGELAVALADFAPVRSRLSVERISGVLGGAAAPSGGTVAMSPAPIGASAALNAGSAASVAVSANSVPQAGTAASWGQTATGKSGGKGLLLVTGAVVSLAALGLAGYAVQRARASAPATVQSSSLNAAAAPFSSSGGPVAAPQVVPSPLATTEPSSAPLTSAAPIEPTTSARAAAVAPKSSSTSRSGAASRFRPAAPSKAAIAPRTSPSAAPSPTPSPVKPAPLPAATSNVFDDR